MKQIHSRIRSEAAVLYAKAHPDVRLQDIGIALGYRVTTAKSMISLALLAAGEPPRPRGFAAPSYDVELARKLQDSTPVISRDAARTLLRDKSKPYIQIAEELDCDVASVMRIAKELGLSRKNGFRVRRPRIADKEVVGFISENPGLGLSETAKRLGYKDRTALYRRLKKIGVCVPRPKHNQRRSTCPS